MKAVLQRVINASVKANGQLTANINKGLLVLLGIEDEDSPEDIEWLCGKIARLRIFDDKNGVMNLSLQEINGDAIVVSQFTLHASTKKGNRPSYIKAAKPEIAKPLYEKFTERLSVEIGKSVGTGIFGAYMEVSLVNDGPVTIIIDTKQKF